MKETTLLIPMLWYQTSLSP